MNWYLRYAAFVPGYWITPSGQVIPTLDHDRDAPLLPTHPKNRRAAIAEGYIRFHVDHAGNRQCQIEGSKSCNDQQTQAIIKLYPSLPCDVVVVDTQIGGGRAAHSVEELKQILIPNNNWRTDIPPSMMWQNSNPRETPTMQHGRKTYPGD